MNRIPKPKKDLTNQLFGHWQVTEQDIEKSQETQKIYWKCQCDCGCGTTKSIRTDALRQVTVGGCNNMLGTHEKECLKCGNKFFTKKQAKTRKYCYECVPESTYENGASLRRLIKKWALEYKGYKCQCCGYDKCIEALEFHHINPEEKDFSISDRDIKLSWEQIKEELDKCVLVCSNCHREIHANVRTLEGSDD